MINDDVSKLNKKTDQRKVFLIGHVMTDSTWLTSSLNK